MRRYSGRYVWEVINCGYNKRKIRCVIKDVHSMTWDCNTVFLQSQPNPSHAMPCHYIMYVPIPLQPLSSRAGMMGMKNLGSTDMPSSCTYVTHENITQHGLDVEVSSYQIEMLYSKRKQRVSIKQNNTAHWRLLLHCHLYFLTSMSNRNLIHSFNQSLKNRLKYLMI